MSIEKAETLLVSDVMLKIDQFPVLDRRVLFKDALDEMNKWHLGIACLVDHNNHLQGVLTDGDIRRQLLKSQKPLSALFVDDALNHSATTPVATCPSLSLKEAVRVMGEKKIWDLPVVAMTGELVGLLHLHPALQLLLDPCSSYAANEF